MASYSQTISSKKRSEKEFRTLETDRITKIWTIDKKEIVEAELKKAVDDSVAYAKKKGLIY